MGGGGCEYVAERKEVVGDRVDMEGPRGRERRTMEKDLGGAQL